MGEPVARFRLSVKHQVVVPKIARDRLGIRAGDEVDLELTEEGLLVRPVRSTEPSPDADPFATWTEWESAEDRAAFDGVRVEDLTPVD